MLVWGTVPFASFLQFQMRGSVKLEFARGCHDQGKSEVSECFSVEQSMLPLELSH